jgi:SAM-dependent methyltransferase
LIFSTFIKILDNIDLKLKKPLQSFNPSILQSFNPPILQSFNPSILQSSNSLIHSSTHSILYSPMNEFWNQRYAEQELAYGHRPNAFFKSWIDQAARPGRLLLPAEGQGRNAVYAAQKGWEVDAFDLSETGQQRALQLAEEMGVSISYSLRDLSQLQLPPDHYDAVGLTFVHMPPPLRRKVHRQLVDSLKPGGRIVMEAFSPEQLGRKSGGPPSLPMLFDPEDLKVDFEALEIEQLESLIVTLDEGPYHQGEAAVVRLVGRK